jgi:hypothetical protein
MHFVKGRNFKPADDRLFFVSTLVMTIQKEYPPPNTAS